ncbi:MAG TPA: UDP-2,4-diacetamido-2,4,6-trideoxy-beta-L-altropyranose hydrolase [Anaerolineales bacterium]
MQALKSKCVPKSGPTVGFVCRASHRIGGGHVMRCLTLASEMKRQGVAVRLAVNAEAWQLLPSLEQAEFAVTTVVTLAETEAWSESLDAIVFDSYEIDSKVERTFRPRVANIVVIDDLADRPHDCDALIDPSWGGSIANYHGLIPHHALVLAGPRYALLRPEFARLRKKSMGQRSTGGPLGRVLVSLGLTDVDGTTARVMARLLATKVQVQFDVVIGPIAESRATLETLAISDRRLKLHINPPDMAGLMQTADLAIGAGGQTSWERCCLGLPTIVMVLADNQRASALGLHEAGAAKVVFGVTDAHLHEVVASFLVLADDAGARTRMAVEASRIVDGRGTHRVWEALRALIPSVETIGHQP